MKVSRQSDFSDFLRVPVAKFDLLPKRRAFAAAFAVDTQTLAALRVPESLKWTTYCQGTQVDPAVSIVVPTYNRQYALGRSLDSIFAVAGDLSIEVIVVDDGSDDETPAFLKKLDDFRVTAVRLPGRYGANMARNVGIAIARAPVISFLDSDDAYIDRRLSDPLSLLDRNPDVGVVISSFVSRKRGSDRLLRLREQTYDGEAFQRLIARYVLPPATSGLTIRRDLLLKCNGFDPEVRRMQDRDLLLRLAPQTRAVTSTVVSWRKHWSDDGISSRRESYYDALCAFLAVHPIYAGEELATRNYLIGRHLVDLVKRGQIGRAAAVYRHARANLSPRLPPLPSVLLRYFATKRQRRKEASHALSKDCSSCDRNHRPVKTKGGDATVAPIRLVVG